MQQLCLHHFYFFLFTLPLDLKHTEPVAQSFQMPQEPLSVSHQQSIFRRGQAPGLF